MNIKLLNEIIVILLIGFFHFPSISGNIRFPLLDVNDGLPSNTIRSIIQDQHGYIWVGTENGLIQYDGYTIKQYLADNNIPNTIADSYILSLELDNNNTLWVSGTSKGFSRYNRDTDDFTVFTHDNNNSNSLSSNTVMVIQKHDDNYLWIATDKGLDRFDTIKKQFIHFPTTQDDSTLLPGDSIRALLNSTNDALWVGSYNGLFLFEPAIGQFKIISLQEGTQPAVRTLTRSRNGTIWVGTLNGLFEYDPKVGSVNKMQFKENVNRVYSSALDSDGNLWVGTSKNGVYRIDNDRKTDNFRPDKSSAYAIKDRTVLTLFSDRTGVMWLGTYGSGFHFFEPKKVTFGSYDNSLNSINCLPSTNIRSALALGDNQVLLGTLSGVAEIDLVNKQCINLYSHSNRSDSLSHNEVYAILKESENAFWLGTTDGLDLLDISTGKIKRFGELINRVSVVDLIKDDEFLLIGTIEGLFKINRTTESLSPLLLDNSIRNLRVSKLQKDKGNRIWIAAKQGLFVLDKNSNKIRRATINGKSVTEKSVTALSIDKDGVIWLAIENMGLFALNLNSQKLESIGDRFGLKLKNGLIGLLIDQKNNLWVSTTSNGIFKIDDTRQSIINYNVSDGLHSELFNLNSFASFSDGHLLFGGKAGFNWFDPEKIATNKVAPIISLANLKRFGKVVVPHQDYDGLMINKHISELEILNLTYRDTVFGFDFVATHFTSPDKITYAYQLQGFDQNWIHTNAQNRGVTYNNIGSGEYTFKVKAQTQNGVWSDNNVMLKILISPAPWLTWWAFVTYFVVFVLSIYLFIKRRTFVLEKRALQLEEIVEIRTEELSNEKNKVEQLLSRKNEEFTNISHEFRTPLTLILGPIAQLLKNIKNKQESGRLKVVQRNGYRLLRMVDQLLNLETFRIKSITQKSPQPVGQIIRQIAEAFSDLANENEIMLEYDSNIDINFLFTPDGLEKIILNLLSNAIKYSKSGGSIVLSTERNDNNELVIKVTDSGIGIPADKLDSIFERYSRVLDDNSEQVTGSGIGLALVKSLIDAHQGRILVESVLGKGSQFSVYLPILGEIDSIDESFHAKDEIIAMEMMSLISQSRNKTDPEFESSQANLAGLGDSSDKTTKYSSGILTEQTERLSILIVEDNQDMGRYLKDILLPFYQCSVVNNGQLGFEKAQEIVPDIILSDIMMPILDGYELAQKLRSHMLTCHIPIVFLTAKGDKESRLEGWRRDIDEYLTKPFDSGELILRLKNILSIRQILANKSDTKNETQRLSDPKLSYDVYDQKFLTKLQSFVELNYTNPKLNLTLVAKNIAMSERQLQRKIKALINKGLPEYIRDYRLACSRELLTQGHSVIDVAYQVGFSSQTYFTACFKALYEITPKKYQKSPN